MRNERRGGERYCGEETVVGKEGNKQDKKHSFKHINPSKPQYIMLDPPQLSCLLVIRTEGHVCYHGATYSDQGYIPACLWHRNFQQFEHARLNTVHFSPWSHMTVVTG